VDQLIQLVIQLVLLPVAFFVGRFTEGRHLNSLALREREVAGLRVCNLKRVADAASVEEAVMVSGQVVIATDYYKSFATKLRNLFGGEMRSAQSLMLRGRREALLRMLLEAKGMGAQEVWNVRYGFCNISSMRGNRGAMQVELFAYGTAVRRKGAAAG
jgi:uncharacterized protein YbjQ (UPF0145 family)